MDAGELTKCTGCGNFIRWRYQKKIVRPMGCTCPYKRGNRVQYKQIILTKGDTPDVHIGWDHNPFFLKAILIPSKSELNCLVYGEDNESIGLTLELTSPSPNKHKYDIQQVSGELFSIEEKEGHGYLLTAYLGEEQGSPVFQFTAKLIHTQGSFDFLDENFPGIPQK